MEPTRRFWSVAVLAVGTAVLAVLYSNPLLVGVTLGIGVWVLAHQLSFANGVSQVADAAPVAQSLSRETILVDDTTLLTIRITGERDTLRTLSAQLSITLSPALTSEDSHEYDLTTGEETITVPVGIQVAGSYPIAPPTLQFTSRGGLFREQLQVGNACTVTAEPRVPRDIHIGTGGEQIAVAYGEHDAAQGGAGFDPGELREYLPGDPANRIDWKATARMGDPYVREFDPDTTRQTQLIVDRRAGMLQGREGQTKLDHAREVGVWLTEYVASLDDPLGLTFVSEADISGSTTPEASTPQYRRIRRELLGLTPSDSRTFTSSPVENPGHGHAGSGIRADHQTAASLDGEDAFDRTLRPYFETVDTHLARVAEDPLYSAVQTRLENRGEDTWLVIVTDDTHRAELLDTVRLAAAQDRYVTVFVLPSVLFETPGLTDLEDAYREYREFESFRQQLTASPNVTAFEVGPRERLAPILESTHTQRANQ